MQVRFSVYLIFAAACSGGPAGPRQDVVLKRDSLGFTHVYGQSDHDALFGAGYAQARDRLLQMELNRRRALGTQAELMGQAFVGNDQQARVLNFAELGRRDWERTRQKEADEADLVQAWCDGVNRF